MEQQHQDETQQHARADQAAAQQVFSDSSDEGMSCEEEYAQAQHHPFFIHLCTHLNTNICMYIEKYGPDEADELYDEEADEADAKWVDNHWRKEATQQGTSQGTETDAILNCPCCFTTLCMDCQRCVK